jgi:hypothetical protein
MNGYKPHKRPKQLFSTGFLISLFMLILLIGGAGGYLKDGPQLEAPATETSEPSPVPDLSPVVYEHLRALSTGETQSPSQSPEYIPNPADVTMLAKLTWGEARGIKSITKQAAVMWCALNRVDAKGHGMGRSVEYVVTFPDQFAGYDPDYPTVDDFGRDLKVLAADVLTRWVTGSEGRVLPAEYLWFDGDGEYNYFRDTYRRVNAHIWDWSLPSPYES